MFDSSEESGLADIKSFTYNGKVLIGNWNEEQRTYKKTVQPIYSIYMGDFTNPNVKLPTEEYWINCLRGQGVPLSHLFGHGTSQEFTRNQSTIYDLCFHHKIQKHTDKSFGILTRTGLKEVKEIKWNESKVRDPYKTTYGRTFHEHPTECLVIKHRRAHECDELIKEPGSPGYKCTISQRKPTKILPAM